MASTLPLLALLSLMALASATDDLDWEAVAVDGREPIILSRSRRADNIKDETKTKLTQSERGLFVTAHNNARSIVSPTASNMPYMVWNTTLENLAQRWAMECKFEHGQPEDDLPHALGQNLWVGSGGYNPSGAVNAWDKEKKDYTYSPKSCADGKVCGHYTQVVWANSPEVGCGIAYCEKIDGFKKPGYIAVCNYYKAGNFKKQDPYEQGTPCSACPDGYSACDQNLCRKEPGCGDLKCEGGENLDGTTCLCECGDDPNNEKGPFCGEHPGNAAGPALGLTPFLLGAVLLFMGM